MLSTKLSFCQDTPIWKLQVGGNHFAFDVAHGMCLFSTPVSSSNLMYIPSPLPMLDQNLSGGGAAHENICQPGDLHIENDRECCRLTVEVGDLQVSLVLGSCGILSVYLASIGYKGCVGHTSGGRWGDIRVGVLPLLQQLLCLFQQRLYMFVNLLVSCHISCLRHQGSSD